MSLFIHTLGWQHQLQILKEEIVDIAGIFDIVVTKTAHYLSLLNLKQKQSFKFLLSQVFEKLTSLTFLNLYNNKLQSLPNRVFDKLIKLKELWLSSNKLQSLPNGVFDKLTSLTHLSLHTNQLKSVPVPSCVDVCQRSQTVHTTCGQRSGTCESYAGIRREISSMKKFEDNRKVQRLKPTHNDVWQCFSACSQCYQNLPITYSTCASVLEKKFKNRHTLAKTSRCDRAFTLNEVLKVSSTVLQAQIHSSQHIHRHKV
uniref:Uncharacterized protein n=1 Tax=Eptatretus burgeri TaxID=7764 RepID=A0A8C4Q023_EPTBU